MEEKGQKIISGSLSVFMRYGIKSITMEDMARQLGMSKKTLYQFVSDKEDLIRQAIDLHCAQEDKAIKSICQKGLNAVDELLEISKWVINMLRHINPSVAYDLERYYPEAHQQMNANRYKAVFECMFNNMKKGQREGLYRKDFHAEIIAKAYYARLDMIFDEQLFPHEHFSLPEIYMELFKYHIRGIASAKGLDYLQERLKTLK